MEKEGDFKEKCEGSDRQPIWLVQKLQSFRTSTIVRQPTTEQRGREVETAGQQIAMLSVLIPTSTLVEPSKSARNITMATLTMEV